MPYATGTGGATAPNQNAGNSAAGTGNAGNKQSGSGTAKAPKKAKTRRVNGAVQYRWPNGSWHSRQYGKQYRPDTPSTGGSSSNGGGSGGAGSGAPDKHPYLTQARADANLQYGGIENSLNARSQAIPAWVADFRTQLAAQQGAMKAYNDPLIQQAQQQVQDAGQVAPGVDPNSAAGQDAQKAAQARGALENLGLTTLKSIGAANSDYLTGRQSVASTAELGMKSDLARDQANVAKEKGQYIVTQRAKRKDDAFEKKLEASAFNVKVADTAADNARQDTQNRQQRQDTLGAVNQYGITEKKWRTMSQAERQKVIARFKQKAGNTAAGGLTAGQVTKRDNAKVSVRKGIAAIKRSLEGRQYAPAGFWGKAYNDLLDGGYDPLLARAVIQIARRGKAGGGIAARVKREYHIKSLPTGKAVKVPPAYVPDVSPQADSGPLAPGQIRPT